ncbi:uncharacterized protein LOC117170669 isoform X2 [Belonocnema kinseyi]|uniref:uncharacterized protein LOC117170669 isoform X2 n=1 Tax=Belonocnema kinseyi TaxID=2817044 RepID=UPI00143DC199|nr:uncharacterized protein LOC117170669 isoform X2 [Belonocnema kinseyi]
MKNHACLWLVIITILSACTCGVRPACNGPTQISVLTGVHDDPACRKLSSRGVLLFEASSFLTELHNNKSSGLQIELAVMDTCGSIAGAMKAAMKALVRADVNCLQPPYYLGIIGPDTMTNAEAVQKVTSVLRVPQIVNKASNSPFLHHLPKESDEYIVRAILKTMDALNWKTFTLTIQKKDNDDDDVQNIAKKLTMEAIAKGLCVLIHEDDQNDFSSNIVHIGKPDSRFFAGPVNATILVVSEGNLQPYLNHISTTNSVILLEDARNDFDDLELRVKKSRWWAEEGSGRYDSEELREVRWLQDAVEVYVNAIENLCKKKKCKNQVSPTDWNNALTSALARQNAEAESAVKVMEILIKDQNSKLAILGKIKVVNNKATIHWRNSKTDIDDNNNDDSSENYDDNFEIIPSTFKTLISKAMETRSGCAISTKNNENTFTDGEDEAARVFVSETDEIEWWTMVMTGSGVVGSMFTMGILGVYIIYSNIRGPRY